MKVNIITDGTKEGTSIYDANTGQLVDLEIESFQYNLKINWIDISGEFIAPIQDGGVYYNHVTGISPEYQKYFEENLDNIMHSVRSTNPIGDSK